MLAIGEVVVGVGLSANTESTTFMRSIGVTYMLLHGIIFAILRKIVIRTA